MKIIFSPQVRDDIRLKTLEKRGDILVINGKNYDLRKCKNCADSDGWICNVEQQKCEVLLPISHKAPANACYPEPVYVENGNIPIPDVEIRFIYTSITVAYGIIPRLRKMTGIYLHGLFGTRRINEIVYVNSFGNIVVLVLPTGEEINIPTPSNEIAKHVEKECQEYMERII